MKRTPTLKPFSKEQMAAAIAAAPDRVHDPKSPYDPNDAASVTTFWAKGKVRLPGVSSLKQTGKKRIICPY